MTIRCSTRNCTAASTSSLSGAPDTEAYRSATRHGWALVITSAYTVVPLCPKCRPVLDTVLGGLHPTRLPQ